MPITEHPPKSEHRSRAFQWLDNRLKISDLTSYMSHKTVPLHGHSIFYYLGGLTLFLFLMQVGTGILLLMYYRPGADTAYESVKYIMGDVSFGWLIRALHSWSANLMILLAFLHLFTVYFTEAYRKPRELTWLSGIVLLALALTFGFSGYLLPWNELSFFATRVGTGMMQSIPLVGNYLLTVLRGGEEVTSATIGRFFGLHVAILPALFSLFLAIHLILIQRQGMSEPIEWQTKRPEHKRYMKFFPNFLYRDLLLWLIVLNVLALLAVIFPDGVGVLHWPLGQKADPFAPPPAVIRPEWYFMFAFQTLKLIPAKVLFLEGEQFGLLVMTIGGLAFALVPFLNKKSQQDRMSRGWTLFGALIVAYILIMTVLGYLIK